MTGAGVPEDVLATAREGADSIFRYVERTAIPDPAGFHWRTLDYDNTYREDAATVFNGMAGIALFLADYHRTTGSSRARELAEGAIRWSETKVPGMLDDWTAPGAPRHDLCFGRTGIGLAWMRLHLATKDAAHLARVRPYVDALHAYDPGKLPAVVTDYLGGVAGLGLFLVRYWEVTGDADSRETAARFGRWLRENRETGERGVCWHLGAPAAAIPPEHNPAYLGYAHGLAGIAHFLVLLHRATGDPQWERLVRDCAATLDRHAVPNHGGLNWPYTTSGSGADKVQWCHGSPGIGLFYAAAYEDLKDPAYLATARAAGDCTFAAGDIRGNPSQCHGLAGNAELFLELYRITGDALWLARAHDFARRMLAYRVETPEGEAWQADEPGFHSPDFMCGASGTGHFFLRLLSGGRLPLALY